MCYSFSHFVQLFNEPCNGILHVTKNTNSTYDPDTMNFSFIFALLLAISFVTKQQNYCANREGIEMS